MDSNVTHSTSIVRSGCGTAGCQRWVLPDMASSVPGTLLPNDECCEYQDEASNTEMELYQHYQACVAMGGSNASASCGMR